MKQTNQQIEMNFKGYDIVIPKGTRVTSQTAMGVDNNYNFIADLSWIPTINVGGKEIKQFGLIHDATYYGINVPKEMVEEVN